MDEDTYIGICEAEGLDEQNSGEILSYDKHVGLNKHYTTYTYGMELSDKAAKSIGFKLGTLGKNEIVANHSFALSWTTFFVTHFD